MNLIIATAFLLAPAFADNTTTTTHATTTTQAPTNTTNPGTASGMTSAATGSNTGASTTGTNTAGANTGAYTTLSDAQIADVVKTANKGEIDASKHAKTHAKNKDVKNFANMMIQHHEKSNQETKQLLSKLKLKAETNDVSHTLEETAQSKINGMKDLKGADYDKAYIQAQIDMHQTVLSSIEQSLLPSAKNAELKAMLEKTRETVASHLSEAKRINGQL
jgi:putative membrane protein